MIDGKGDSCVCVSFNDVLMASLAVACPLLRNVFVPRGRCSLAYYFGAYTAGESGDLHCLTFFRL